MEKFLVLELVIIPVDIASIILKQLNWHASSYAEQLREKGHVIANFSERRDEVRIQAESAAKALGGVAKIDDALLDEVTALIEYPIAVSGSFGEEFLRYRRNV